jgi:hypothetical protein
MRPPINTSIGAKAAGGKSAGADSPVRADRDCESDGSTAPVMESLKQTGMLVVLVLLSEGFFVLSGGQWHGDASRTKAATTMEFAGGVILCSSAVMLLYSLGTRDEK